MCVCVCVCFMWSTLTPLLRFNKILGTILWVLFLVLTDVCVQMFVGFVFYFVSSFTTNGARFLYLGGINSTISLS